MDQYEGTFHGGGRGRTLPSGGTQNSGPRGSPELFENSFSDKSAMAKRLELVLGPGDFEKHGFQAILGAQKSQKKIHAFLKTQCFQLLHALGPIPSSFSCPEDILQCPSQALRPSGGLVLTDFFLRQKFHFGKTCPIF